MSASLQPRLALIGMPRTGKSTYLGALWALIQSPLEGSVSEASFSGDRSYIQRLTEQVARGEELDRTGVDANEWMGVELEFDALGTADVMIPDTSGESLRFLVEGRMWHPRLWAACEQATAVAIFVHPERMRAPQPISLLAAAGINTDAISAESEQVTAFDVHDHASTAAELIDVFENLAELCRERWPIRVAVIVSAWDTVYGNPTPYEWLRTRLPGLLATIESNPDIAELEVFGVSAQGGSLDARQELLEKGEICDRVFASGRDGQPVSLVAPVRWAIYGA
jgi:Double-GTPase 1